MIGTYCNLVIPIIMVNSHQYMHPPIFTINLAGSYMLCLSAYYSQVEQHVNLIRPTF